METKKYISLDKMQKYDVLIKEEIDERIDANKTIVDSALSSTSTNPVENKVLEAEFEAISQAMNVFDAALDDKANNSHTHNDVYYTQTQINTKLDEIDTKLDGKSDTSHSHDDKYYTESEVDEKIATVNTSITNSTNETKSYADNGDTTTLASAQTYTDNAVATKTSVTVGGVHQETFDADSKISVPTTFPTYGVVPQMKNTGILSYNYNDYSLGSLAAAGVNRIYPTYHADDTQRNFGTSNKVLSTGTPKLDKHCANKAYVDTQFQSALEVAQGKAQTFTITDLAALGTLFGIDTTTVADDYTIATTEITYNENAYSLHQGDIFLIVDTNVPDYWISVDDMKLYKMETTKVDLTEYATKSELEETETAIYSDLENINNGIQDNSNRIGTVETDYVPKNELETLMNEHPSDLGTLTVIKGMSNAIPTGAGGAWSDISYSSDATPFNLVQRDTDGNIVLPTDISKSGVYTAVHKLHLETRLEEAFDIASNNLASAKTELQGKIDAKQDTITGGASTITSSNLTVDRALISDASGKVAVSEVTSTELGYLDGVSSNVQTQLDKKAGLKMQGVTYTDANGGSYTCGGEVFNIYTEEQITIDENFLPVQDVNIASGAYSHAEGAKTAAHGSSSHAEGFNTMTAFGASSAHAEGNQTIASGQASHAEGNKTTASGNYSHAEGSLTTASGGMSHAEGVLATASGNCSHAEGHKTTASGDYSHAEGYFTTSMAYQHAQGHYNNTTLAKAGTNSGTGSGTAFVIGNGTSSSASNAFRVDYNGKPYAKSTLNSSGADYAEFFEWQDLNLNAEDRRGYFVTLDGDKIKIAEPNDYILGIISGMPSVAGNGDEDWMGRYILDEFGAFIYEDFEYEEEIFDKETGKVKTVVKTGKKYKENPEYDPSLDYIQREDRPEWDYVGMLGVLSVRDDGTCKVNGYCKVADGGIATSSETGYRVIKRVNDNIVKVIFR